VSFFHYFGTGGWGPFNWENSDKTGNLGNFILTLFIQVVIKLKLNASILGVLEITDFFLSYNTPFSFLFSFFIILIMIANF
jgi:hypothetical protein